MNTALCYAKSLQLCAALCDSMDCSPPGSSVHWILQTRTGVSCHALPQGIFLIQELKQSVSLISPALSGGFFITSAIWEAPYNYIPVVYLLKIWIYMYMYAHVKDVKI